MKSTMFSLILFLTMALTANAADQPATNNLPDLEDPVVIAMLASLPKGLPTNGLYCVLQFGQDRPRPRPVCFVSVVNTTTNFIKSILRLPREVSCKMELLDSEGRKVEQISAVPPKKEWADQEMEAWWKENTHIRRGKISLFWPETINHVDEFGIPEIFQVKRSGEYTLHLQTRLVTRKLDASQKPHYESLWLPEVVAKIKISPEDIPQTETPPTGQKNTPPK